MLYDYFLGYLNRNNIRGKDRLYALLTKVGFKQMLRLQCKYGLTLNLNPNEYIDSLVIKEGFYESEVTEAILSCLQSNDVFWDIGANIGLQGLAVKKQMPQVDVKCFEPNPTILALLIANANINGLKIGVCSFALSEKEGITDLYIAEGNSGMSTLTPWGDNYKTTLKCQALTGNYLVKQGFTIPNVLKIDTEGSELSVLKGCSEILGHSTCRALVIELENNLHENLETNEFAQFLQQYGFKNINKLQRKEQTHHNLSNFLFSK